jgi:hypothetical protein
MHAAVYMITALRLGAKKFMSALKRLITQVRVDATMLLKRKVIFVTLMGGVVTVMRMRFAIGLASAEVCIVVKKKANRAKTMGLVAKVHVSTHVS